MEQNIATVTSLNFLHQTAVMLKSAIRHSSVPICFWILASDVPESVKTPFSRAFADKCEIKFLGVAQKRKKTHSHFTSDEYLKSGLRLIPNSVSKVLYLDSDIVSRADLGPLFKIDIGRSILAAVDDPIVDSLRRSRKQAKRVLIGSFPRRIVYGSLGEYLERHLGIGGSTPYFNSGVMLVNLAQWKSNGLSHSLEKAAKTPNRYLFVDQDVLNRELAGQFVKLDPEWNFMNVPEWMFQWASESVRDRHAVASKNPFLIHFAGGQEKPWLKNRNPYAQTYWQELAR